MKKNYFILGVVVVAILAVWGLSLQTVPQPIGKDISIRSFIELENEHVQPSKVVKVGYFSVSKFMKGANDQEEKTGYGYEYMQKLASITGWQYVYEYDTWPNLLEKLQKGEIDLLADVSYTPERTNTISFPKLSMGEENFYIFTKPGNTKLDANNLATFNGARIGVNRGSLQEKLLVDWGIQHGLQLQIVPYSEDIDRHSRELNDGKLDAVVELDLNADAVDLTATVYLGKADFFMAVNKQRPDLLFELDMAQREITETYPGYLNNLRSKYYGNVHVKKSMSQAEAEWLATHKELRIGYLYDFAPYSYYDEELGGPAGAAIDLFADLKEVLQLENLNLVYRGYDSYNDMKRDLQRGKVDVIAPAFKDLWMAERQGYRETETIHSVGMNRLTRNDVELANVKRVAVTYTTLGSIFSALRYEQGAELVYYASTDDCIDAVAVGAVDATYVNSYLLQACLRHNQNGRYLKADQVDDVKMCLAVDNDTRGLLSILDKGIDRVPDLAFERSVSKHSTHALAYTVKDFLRDNWLPLFLISVLFICVCVTLYWVNKGRRKLIRANNKITEQQELLQENLRMAEEHAEEENALNEELVAMNDNLEKSRAIIGEQLGIINGFSSEYYTVYIIKDKDHQTMPYRITDKSMQVMLKQSDDGRPFEKTFAFYIEHMVFEDDWPKFEVARDYAKLREATADGQLYTINFRRNNGELGTEYHQIVFTRTGNEYGDDNLVMAFRYIDDVLKREQVLAESLEAAENANKAKTVFLSNMSHDIRTPMNGILGYTNLASAHADDPMKVREYLRKISISGQHMLSLINDILDMSRIESGHYKLELEPLDIKELLDSIYTIIISDAAAKQISLELLVDELDNTLVECDRLRMNRILLNLLSNAIKFSHAGGKIILGLRQLPADKPDVGRYEFRVKDYGIGMSAEFMERLYVPFERENDSTHSGIQGTGLGMAITKNIVDMMQGSIEVQSELGKGTEFTVTLEFPLADHANLPANREEAEEPDLTDFTGYRVLLTEDNLINQEIAQTLLESVHFQVDVANNGQEAVERVSVAPPGYYDVVLMDIQMPIMNGYQATHAIRHLTNPVQSNVPIIAMTANAFEDDKQNAFSSGMNEHVAKPFDPEKLMRTIAKFLK